MPRILIVDDEASVRYGLRVLLESLGHEIAEAGGGEEAVAMQRREPADVVLCDLFMPEQDGLVTIPRLRQLSAAPIVAMSGGTSRLDGRPFLEMARELGADILLSKPFGAA